MTGHRDPWEKRLPRAPSKGASDPGEESVTVPRDPQGRPPLTPLPSRQQHNQTRLNSRDSADAGAARGGDSGPPRPARTSAAARCNSSSVGEAVTRGPHGTPTLLTGTSGLPSPWRRNARPHGYGHVHSGHEGRPCPSRPPGSNTERTRGVAAWGGGRCPPNLAAGPRRAATPRAGRGGRPRDAPHRSGSGERSRADSACGRRGRRGNVRSGGCQCRKWPQRRCHWRASNLRSAVRSDRGASLTSQAGPAHGAAVPGRRQVPVA